jgi:hypothetical protein
LRGEVKHLRYALFVRHQKPSDIDSSLVEHDAAFTNLLQFTTDVRSSGNVDAADVKFDDKDSERVQPDYRAKGTWIPTSGLKK